MTAAGLEPGDFAPDFELPDQDGNSVRLADLAGKTVVIYFYPKDDTPGCTTQACAIRDRYEEFGDTVVLGISPDDSASHAKFQAKHDLPFPLLSDTDHRVAEAYGVWIEKSMYGRTYWGNQRSTFVIGPDRVIRSVFRKVKAAKHDELVLEALGELSAPG